MHNQDEFFQLAKKLLNEIAALRNSIDSATSYQRERDEKAEGAKHEPPPIVLSAELKEPEAAQTDRRTRDDRNHAQQVWLTWGTWLAFIAAAIYAGISYRQMDLLHTANEQGRTQWETEHRPWVSTGEIRFQRPPVFLVYPDNPPPASTQISFVIEVPIKNVGLSPALHVETEMVGTMTKEIAAPPAMENMMERACGMADGNATRVGGMQFPNSPETVVERNENIAVPVRVNEVQRIWLAICTAYTGTDSSERLHHTKIWLASWPIRGKPTEISRNRKPFQIIYYSLPIPSWGVVRTAAD